MNNMNLESKNDDTILDILDISKLNETLKMVNNALNVGCKGGVYSLDEAYLLKIGASNLEKAVKVLDSYQKFVVDLKKQNEQNNQNNQNNQNKEFGKKKIVKTDTEPTLNHN
jgi:hypothetical protein